MDDFKVYLLDKVRQLESERDNLRTDLKVTKQALESLKGERKDIDSENEALRSAMSAVMDEMPKSGFISFGNAPGHCHEIPGIWDQGNGDKAGKECGWCKVWNAAIALRKAASHD